MIDVHYASLTSQGVQDRVFCLDGEPSRYQPHPTGLNFGEQAGTGVFPLVIAVPFFRIFFIIYLFIFFAKIRARAPQPPLDPPLYKQ